MYNNEIMGDNLDELQVIMEQEFIEEVNWLFVLANEEQVALQG